MSIFCDWLDVTYSPIDNPREELRLFLGNIGYECKDYTSTLESWSHPNSSGFLHSEVKENSHARLSASGSVLEYLRSIGQYENYLALLSLSPYRVTRLDAALDMLCDAAPYVDRLIRLYPSECSLSRQRSLKTTFLLSTRPDGLLSGTFYAGCGSRAIVTARVYDKALEAWEKRSQILPPTTRCELTFRQGLATLSDALEPAAIFWAHSASLVDLPKTIPEWLKGSDIHTWSYVRPEVLPAVAMAKRVAYSSDLTMLLELSDKLGKEGGNHLMHLLCQRLGIEHKGTYFKKAI